MNVLRLVQQLAVVVPPAPELAAAADVRDREHHAAVEQAHPRRRERRVDRHLVRAVAVEQQRAAGRRCGGRAGTRSRSGTRVPSARGRPEPPALVLLGVVPGHRLALHQGGDAGRRGRSRRPTSASPATCTRTAASSSSYSGFAAEPRRVHGSSGIAITWSSATSPSSPSVSTRRCSTAVGALGDDEEAGERVDVVEADVGAVGEHASSSDARPGRRDRRDHQREVLGAVGVGEHEEPVAGGAGVVLDVVLVTLLARLDDARRGGRRRRRRPATPRSSPSTPT